MTRIVLSCQACHHIMSDLYIDDSTDTQISMSAVCVDCFLEEVES